MKVRLPARRYPPNQARNFHDPEPHRPSDRRRESAATDGHGPIRDHGHDRKTFRRGIRSAARRRAHCRVHSRGPHPLSGRLDHRRQSRPSADPNHILGHGYVFIIAARHGAAFPERRLDFINRGVSGNTVLDLEKRWQKDTLDLKPDVLSILIGVNDERPRRSAGSATNRSTTSSRPGQGGEPQDQVGALRSRFAKPTGKVSEGIRKRQEIVARLAKNTARPSCSSSRLFDEAAKRAPADYWVWDRVHPTYRGHQLMADEWERVVREFWK